MSTVSKIIRLTRQLYPTGRAWLMPDGSVFAKLHTALADSEANAHTRLMRTLDSALPENAQFDEADAANWERALGLLVNPSVSLDDRKLAIQRKINHPGAIKARQHYKYIEGQLQAAGFNVYVHEQTNPVRILLDAKYGRFSYGTANYGQVGVLNFGFQLIANYLDPAKDAEFNVGGPVEQRSLFFIGGEVFGDQVAVPAVREKEFRDLVLKLKPAHTVAISLVEFTAAFAFGLGADAYGIGTDAYGTLDG